jgi:Protein of unknown function (DUF3429)
VSTLPASSASTDPRLHAVPPAPHPAGLRLGYAGLIPFVLGTLLALLVREDLYHYVALGLAGYGAVIVSLLGGIHWGLGMRPEAGASAAGPVPLPFAWGVAPSLVAWIAIVMPPDAGLVVLGVMLVVCYLVDRRTYPAYGLGGWLTLRFRLTVVASLSCFIAAAGY